jgi:hypothetical protein
VRRPSRAPTPEPVIDSPDITPEVGMMQEPVVAPIGAASVPESGAAEPAADAIVRLNTQGVMRIGEALGRLGMKGGLGVRQKTALAALTPEQQLTLAKWLDWCAAHRKTTFVILAVVVVELLGMINKLAS